MGMFFLYLTAMIICFVVGTTLLVKGTVIVGTIAMGVGIVLLLFILIYYGNKKHRKNKYDCTPDCDCTPDFDGDCGPDCDCSPDCN
jgi:hypothetical protein